MTSSNNMICSTVTWWEEEKGIRAIKYATIGAIWMVFLGIIIAVTDGVTIERSFFLIIFFAFIGALSGAMGIECEDKYLFNWNEVPGNCNGRLIEFLEKKFDAGWVKTANIDKIDNDRTVRISSGKKYFLLRLNDEKTEVDLKIDDGRTAKFNAKAEKSKLNIYEDSSDWNLNWG